MATTDGEEQLGRRAFTFNRPPVTRREWAEHGSDAESSEGKREAELVGDVAKESARGRLEESFDHEAKRASDAEAKLAADAEMQWVAEEEAKRASDAEAKRAANDEDALAAREMIHFALASAERIISDLVQVAQLCADRATAGLETARVVQKIADGFLDSDVAQRLLKDPGAADPPAVARAPARARKSTTAPTVADKSKAT